MDHAARTMALIASCALAACGPPPGPPSARTVRSSRAPSGDGCAATQTRLGGECWNAAGTRWTVEAEGPGGNYRFDLELMGANRARSTDHAAASPASDEWVQDGPLLRVFLSDRYVEYRARVSNGTVLLGEAHNVRGQRWAFMARRAFGPPACLAQEARFGTVCMTLAGTGWRLGEGEEATTVRFAAGGEVQADGVEDVAGRWEQEGASLSFELADVGRMSGRFEGELEDEDTLHLRRDAQALPATRLESFPPVIER
ncbi:MAG: hypothetical protein AB8I08_36030 [Sandaracinaceae bacterium]